MNTKGKKISEDIANCLTSELEYIEAFKTIRNLSRVFPNDFEFGREVRKTINSIN